MSCPQDHPIVRLVGGELAEAEEREVRQHLAMCATCAEAFRALRGTWDDLGAWTVEPSAIDLTDRVLARSATEEPKSDRSLRSWKLEAFHLRVAASIGVAAGLGIASGALLSSDQLFQGSPSPGTPTAMEVVDTLGLEDLATPSATGLPLGFEPNGSSEGEDES